MRDGMEFENNFFVAPLNNGTTMLDPVLKLRLRTGRWSPESAGKGGDIDVDLLHDPEIEAGRLTMPASEKLKEISEMLGNTPPTEEVFQSNQSRNIAKIVVIIDQRGDDIALICDGGQRPTFINKVGLIRTAKRGMVSKQPWQTLLYFLRSILMLPYWEFEFAKTWDSKRISIYVSRPLALELAEHTGFQMLPDDGELVGIASREIRA